MKLLNIFIEEFNSEFEAIKAIAEQHNAYFRRFYLKYNDEFDTYSLYETVID